MLRRMILRDLMMSMEGHSAFRRREAKQLDRSKTRPIKELAWSRTMNHSCGLN
jgi:hypothetical protein